MSEEVTPAILAEVVHEVALKPRSATRWPHLAGVVKRGEWDAEDVAIAIGEAETLIDALELAENSARNWRVLRGHEAR